MRSNTDLSDNELEITVIRGIAYSVANPKDVDTYVKIEFPYPQVGLHENKIGKSLPFFVPNINGECLFLNYMQF